MKRRRRWWWKRRKTKRRGKRRRRGKKRNLNVRKTKSFVRSLLSQKKKNERKKEFLFIELRREFIFFRMSMRSP